MSEGNGTQFTPRHRQLLAILSDGEFHSFAEVLRRMGYTDEDQQTMFVHISTLRKALRPMGQAVVKESGANGVLGYRHVVLVTPAVLDDILSRVNS